MTRVQLWCCAAIVVLCSTSPAFAQYGSSCGGQCGIGNDIQVPTISCSLADSSCNSLGIPCQSNVTGYGALPTTVDPTKFLWTFTSNASDYGGMSAAWGLNTADRTYASNTQTTTHKVCTDHMVPAGGVQSFGQTGYTFYAYTSARFPITNSDSSLSTYPGPTCANQGLNCYFRVTPPPPTAALPFTFEANVIGHMGAWAGGTSMIPVLAIWHQGSFASASALPAQPIAANTIAHTSSNAPNSGNWYVSDGAHWNLDAAHPVAQVTSLTWTNTGTGDLYTCHPDANGNVNPSTHAVQNTCTGTAGDSGVALVPFYPGAWSFGNSSTYYRQIEYDSSTGQYDPDITNILSPPSNPQSTFTLEVISNSSAVLGNFSACMTLTTYTDGTHHTPATNTPPVTVCAAVNMHAPGTLTASRPGSFSTDTSLPQYLATAAKGVVNMCSNPNAEFSTAWWNQPQRTWLWLPVSPTDFGEFYAWNYDNSRVALEGVDQFLQPMTGGTWSDFTGGATYGSSYSNSIILPLTNNPNGYVFVALNSGTASGSGSNWQNIAIGSTVTNGGVTFFNAGNRAYYNQCAKWNGDPYLMAMVLSGGRQSVQFTLFTGGADRQRQQTGDAQAISGGTTTGRFTRLETDVYCYSPSGPGCSTDNAASGYWGGGAFSIQSSNAGRGTAYQVDAAATFLRLIVQNSTTSQWDTQRKAYTYYLLNNILNYWDFIQHQDVGATTTNVLDNLYPATLPYMTGVGMEAVIEWYNSCSENDPSNTITGLCSSTAQQNAYSAMKSMADFVNDSWFDQQFKGANSLGIHNYSYGYNPKDLQLLYGAGNVGGTSDPFANELNNLTAPVYAQLYDYCGGSCTSTGGIGYDTIADTVRNGGFDAYNCNQWKCTPFTGGAWLKAWSNGTGTPKTLGQSLKWGLSNHQFWRTGNWTATTDDLSKSNNPCWTGGTNCSTPQPFADVEAPFMFQLKRAGTSYYYQDDPGDEGQFVGDQYSPILNVTSTSAEVQFNTYENSSSSAVLYGTSSGACTSSQNSEEAGYPQLVSGLGTSQQVYVHRFQLTGLVPNTRYYSKFSVTDPSNNNATNSCTSQIFQGSGINFLTLNQTVLSILTTSLPNGSTTAAYSQQLQAAGGNPPYTWSIVSGSLPTGLNLASSTGVISGTPSAGGTFNFTVQVADSATPPHTAQQPLSITITDLRVTTTSLPAGTSGSAYSATLAATGGTLPYTWAIKTGTLPPNLTFNTSTGAIGGTPQACGSFFLSFQVTDSSTPTPEVAVSIPLKLTINGCSPLQILTGQFSDAIQNVPYNATLTASGGTLPYTWSITAGALPAGITLDPTTCTNSSVPCLVSGTSATLGTASFTVQVADSASNTAQANLSITTVAALGIVTTSLNNCTQGVACTNTVSAVGGVTPYTWCIQEANGACDDGTGGALPAGLALVTSNNQAIISGTPTGSGTSTFTVQVTDSTPTSPQTATQPLSITVTSSLQITTSVLPGGTLGFPYIGMVQATGGIPPYTWCVIEASGSCDDGSGGGLPPGITINATSGQITGTPTMTGIYTPTFRVQDTQGTRAQKMLGIVINPALILHTGLIGNASMTGDASVK